MYGNIVPLQNQNNRFTAFGAFVSLSIEDKKVIEGITWSIRKRLAVVKATSVDIILDPTAFTGKLVVLQPLAYDSIGGPLNIDIYVGATADNDGTLIQPINRNLLMGGVGEVIYRLAPSNVVAGANPPLELFSPSDGAGAVGISGEGSADSLVAVLNPTVKYLLRITNTDAVTDATIGIKIDHFEVR